MVQNPLNVSLIKELKNYHAAPNLQKLFQNSATADVHFIFDCVDGVKRIAAHKCLLAIASTVFNQMFFGVLKEGADVHIVDASPDEFTEFLQFFYLDKITLTSDNIADVMKLADKYDVSGCMNLCAQFLELTLSTESVCWYYELGILYDLSHLNEICAEKICMETKRVFESNTFVNCGRHVLTRILSMEELSCDEINVFEACMNWSIEACKRGQTDPSLIENRKRQLDNCFDLIRFPAMTSEEFSICIGEQDGLFSGSEIIDILSHLTLHRPLKVATRFKQNARQGAPAWIQDDSICICDRRSLPHLCRSVALKRDSVIFSVNERILLGQISISTFKLSTTENEALSPEFRSGMLYFKKIVTNSDEMADENTSDNHQLLLSQSVQISSATSSKIKLNKPIVVQPFQDYEIETDWELDGGEELVIRTECRNEVMIDGGIRFQFLHRPNILYDNVTEGLVARFYYKKW